MKACSFLATFSLAIFMANALTTEEHVRTMFRPEHRVHLPEPGMLNLQEDDSSALVSNLNTQGDESTKCLALCEPKCDKLNVPYYLQVMSVLLKWFLSLKNRLKARVNSFQVSAYISLSHELPSRLTKNILAPKIQRTESLRPLGIECILSLFLILNLHWH